MAGRTHVPNKGLRGFCLLAAVQRGNYNVPLHVISMGRFFFLSLSSSKIWHLEEFSLLCVSRPKRLSY